MFRFRYRFFFFLFLFISGYLFSQKVVDSLVKTLRFVNDSIYVVNCCSIADEYVELKKPAIAFYYLDSAMKKAIQIKNFRTQAYVYNNKGNTYNYLNDFGKALDNFEKAIDIYKKINYLTGIVNALINKVNTFFYAGELSKAEGCYLKCIESQL